MQHCSRNPQQWLGEPSYISRTTHQVFKTRGASKAVPVMPALLGFVLEAGEAGWMMEDCWWRWQRTSSMAAEKWLSWWCSINMAVWDKNVDWAAGSVGGKFFCNSEDLRDSVLRLMANNFKTESRGKIRYTAKVKYTEGNIQIKNTQNCQQEWWTRLCNIYTIYT